MRVGCKQMDVITLPYLQLECSAFEKYFEAITLEILFFKSRHIQLEWLNMQIITRIALKNGRIKSNGRFFHGSQIRNRTRIDLPAD